MRSCVELIDKCGWMIQGVFGTEQDPGPSYAYTVGLTAHGFPELAVAGLPPQVMQTLLNDVAKRVFDLNRRYTHGEVLDDVLGGGYKVMVVDGPASRDTIWPGTANALFGEEGVTLQQLVWPDDQHRYPWDENYSLPVDAQPVIGRPR
jgi:hypothetical protein